MGIAIDIEKARQQVKDSGLIGTKTGENVDVAYQKGLNTAKPSAQTFTLDSALSSPVTGGNAAQLQSFVKNRIAENEKNAAKNKLNENIDSVVESAKTDVGYTGTADALKAAAGRMVEQTQAVKSAADELKAYTPQREEWNMKDASRATNLTRQYIAAAEDADKAAEEYTAEVTKLNSDLTAAYAGTTVDETGHSHSGGKFGKTEEQIEREDNLKNRPVLTAIEDAVDVFDVNLSRGLGTLDKIDYWLSKKLGLIDEDHDAYAYEQATSFDRTAAATLTEAEEGRGKVGQTLLEGVAAAGNMFGQTAVAYLTGIPQAANALLGATFAGMASTATPLGATATQKAAAVATRGAGRFLGDVTASVTNTAISTSSAVDKYDEVMQSGGNETAATSAALAAFFGEYLANKLFEGAPLEDAKGAKGFVTEDIEAIAKALGKEAYVQKFFGNAIAHRAYSIIGEGLEEVVTGIVEPIAAKATYDPDAKIQVSELVDEFIGGMVLSAIMDGGGDVVKSVAVPVQAAKLRKEVAQYSEQIDLLLNAQQYAEGSRTKALADSAVTELYRLLSEGDTDSVKAFFASQSGEALIKSLSRLMVRESASAPETYTDPTANIRAMDETATTAFTALRANGVTGAGVAEVASLISDMQSGKDVSVSALVQTGLMTNSRFLSAVEEMTGVKLTENGKSAEAVAEAVRRAFAPVVTKAEEEAAVDAAVRETVIETTTRQAFASAEQAAAQETAAAEITRAAQNTAQNAAQNAAQNTAQNAAQDAAQDAEQNAEQNAQSAEQNAQNAEQNAQNTAKAEQTDSGTVLRIAGQEVMEAAFVREAQKNGMSEAVARAVYAKLPGLFENGDIPANTLSDVVRFSTAKVVENGEVSGGITETQFIAQELIGAAMKDLGVKVRVVSEKDNPALRGANGLYADGVLYVNADQRGDVDTRTLSGIAWVVGHEFVHGIGTPAIGRIKAVMRQLAEDGAITGVYAEAATDDAAWGKLRDRTRQLYKNFLSAEAYEKIASDDAYFDEEICADFLGTLLGYNKEQTVTGRLGSKYGRADLFYKLAALDPALVDEMQKSAEKMQKRLSGFRMLGKKSKTEYDRYSKAMYRLLSDLGRARIEAAGDESTVQESYDRYSLNPQLEDELVAVKNRSFPSRQNEVLVGTTSDFLVRELKAPDLFVLMPPVKAYRAMVTEAEAVAQGQPKASDNIHYHGLGVAGLVEALKESERPIAAFAEVPPDNGAYDNRICLVTGMKRNGNNIVVFADLDDTGNLNGQRIRANKDITIFDDRRIVNMIREAEATGRMLYFDKNRSSEIAGGQAIIGPDAIRTSNFYDDNIEHFWENVKWKKDQKAGKNVTDFGPGATKTPMQIAMEKAVQDADGETKTPALPSASATKAARSNNGAPTGVSTDDANTTNRRSQEQKSADILFKGLPRYSVAGKNAATADLKALDRAMALEQKGKDRDTIFASTRWWKDPADGMWRYEINDKPAKFRNNADAAQGVNYDSIRAEYRSLRPKYKAGELQGKELEHFNEIKKQYLEQRETASADFYQYGGKIGDVIKHDALFAAYPQLAETRFRFEAFTGDNYDTGGWHDPVTNTISLNKRILTEQAFRDRYAGAGGNSTSAVTLSILLHEMQHAIQTAEGFASGGNQTAIRNVIRSIERALAVAKQRQPEKVAEIEADLKLAKEVNGVAFEPYLLYYALRGEQEARSTQHRQNWDMKQRLEKPPHLPENKYKLMEDYRRLSQKYAGWRYSVSESGKATEGGGEYDSFEYMKPFEEQLQDYKAGKFDKNNSFVLGTTPKILQEIGLLRLPLTMDVKHVSYALNGDYSDKKPDRVKDHLIPLEELAKLPEKIEHPVAIIEDRQRGKKYASEYKVDVIVEMIVNGKNTLVPVAINTKGYINGLEIDANGISSAHGNADILDRLRDAIENDSDEDVRVYYLDKGKTTAAFLPTGNPISSTAELPDGFVHSINDEGSPVKLRFDSETKSQQFKRWFGKSKVKKADGTPRVVYHYTDSVFDEFKPMDASTGSRRTLGDGYYVSTDPEEYKTFGENRMELYASIAKPFEMSLTKAQAQTVYDRYFRKFHEDRFHTYEPHVVASLQASTKVFSYLKEAAEQNDTTTSAILSELGFDGVHDGSVWVAFQPTQLKSATDNIGTYDASNPNIRYSPARPPATGNPLTDQERVMREIARRLSSNYKGPLTEEITDDDLRQALGLPVQDRETQDYEDWSASRRSRQPVSAEQSAQNRFHRETRDAVSVPKYDPYGRKTNKTAQTLINSQLTDDAMAETLKSVLANGELSHDVHTNDATIHRAERKIVAADGSGEGWENAFREFTDAVDAGKADRDTVALGIVLYNNAVTSGDGYRALDAATYLVKAGNSIGSAMQTLRMLNRLTPEGKLYTAVRGVENIADQLRKTYGDEFTVDIDRSLLEDYRDALANGTTEEQKTIWNAIQQNIADQMPADWKMKLTAWRYLSMLGNPRTHVRNIAGNAFFIPARLAKQAVKAGLERAVLGKSGQGSKRMTAVLNAASAEDRARLTAAWADYGTVLDPTTYTSVEELIQSGGKYNDTGSGIENRRTVFRTKGLEGVRKLNNEMLDREDTWFSRPAYAEALASAMKAKGIDADDFLNGNVAPAILDEIRTHAVTEAQKATYRDLNGFSEFISGIGKAGRNKNAKGWQKAWTVVSDAALPFKKTPANILARAYEYSPLEIGNVLLSDRKKVQSGEMSVADMLDHLASGLVGAGLMGLGVLLRKLGWVIGAWDDDDEKQSEFDEMNGQQEYSINIGNKNYTIDWLAPEALPFFVGVAAYDAFERDSSDAGAYQKALDALLSLSEPMLNMSMLSSVNDLIDNIGYMNDSEKVLEIAKNLGWSYVQQFFPTAFGQIERVTEDTRYSTYAEPDAELDSTTQRAIGKIANKLPGEYNQVEYVDAWGRTKSTGNVMQRIARNMIYPWYQQDYAGTENDTELQRLYDIRDEDGNRIYGSVFPTRTKQKTKVDGVAMSGEEYEVYAKLRGSESLTGVTELLNSGAYARMEDAAKAKAIEKVYEDAKGKAENAVREMRGKETSDTDAEALGMSGETYATAFTIYSSATTPKGYQTTESGKTPTWAKALALIGASGLTESEKLAYLNKDRENVFTSLEEAEAYYSKQKEKAKK